MLAARGGERIRHGHGRDPWTTTDAATSGAGQSATAVSVRNLSRLFAPERIAVVGAGPDPASVGGIVMANLTDGSYAGEVHLVSDRHRAVRGIEAAKSVSELAQPPDLAVVCTPAATVPALVRECGAAGVAGVLVISAGFRETGAEGARARA